MYNIYVSCEYEYHVDMAMDIKETPIDIGGYILYYVIIHNKTIL